jgi:hypothetical protein
MLLTEYLFTKALEEATEESVAFSKAANFGLEHIDEKEKKPQRIVLGAEINDILVFFKLLREEGVPIATIGDPEDMTKWRERFEREMFEVLGKEGGEAPPETIHRALLILGASRAALLAKAFTKTLTFGIDSVDPATGISNRIKIATMFNALCVVIKMLMEEGVEIPGIGEEGYLEARYEKAVAGATAAHVAGIIEDGLNISKEDIENGGVVQAAANPVDNVDPAAIDQETGNRPEDLDTVCAYLYGEPSGGDAAPNAIVSIEQ